MYKLLRTLEIFEAHFQSKVDDELERIEKQQVTEEERMKYASKMLINMEGETQLIQLS